MLIFSATCGLLKAPLEFENGDFYGKMPIYSAFNSDKENHTGAEKLLREFVEDHLVSPKDNLHRMMHNLHKSLAVY